MLHQTEPSAKKDIADGFRIGRSDSSFIITVCCQLPSDVASQPRNTANPPRHRWHPFFFVDMHASLKEAIRTSRPAIRLTASMRAGAVTWPELQAMSAPYCGAPPPQQRKVLIHRLAPPPHPIQRAKRERDGMAVPGRLSSGAQAKKKFG
jgi:hypothetical protein